MSKDTIMFEAIKKDDMTSKEILTAIYDALTDRGYNAQIVLLVTWNESGY